MAPPQGDSFVNWSASHCDLREQEPTIRHRFLGTSDDVIGTVIDTVRPTFSRVFVPDPHEAIENGRTITCSQNLRV